VWLRYLTLWRTYEGWRSGAGERTVAIGVAASRPDLVAALRQPFAWDHNDEQSRGEDPFFSLPVIFDIDRAPRISFVGWYIRDAQRHAFASVEDTLRGGIPARRQEN
jgi:hypothetical protein